ncbi:phosphatase PAP2 family protein [Sphingomonas sp. BIUV-7]|uniref:Phosphatase PAP2 family protein n=1 Tax=Sphingomonas natans TaxID=3063330 RepID=A0ABT8Y7Z5_9SPHN|nr:phosphatase PAP2 family protein [Sphingomonas sp. BIUV-7]MDO6413820.1 phosphatase PAP2 family protein [Sphingomonas sp. BIUV-7]
MARTRKLPTKPTSRTAIEQADLVTAHKAGQWRDHPIIKRLGTLSELADQPQLYAICASTVAIGVLRGNGRLARAGLRMLAAEWLATKAKSFIKHRVDRSRPHVPVNGGHYRMQTGHSHESALNSFPSGHTAGAVAVARAYASEYPEHAGRAAAIAIFVGAIQIPRCAHFVSDVGAGAAIGLAAGSLAAKKTGQPTDEASAQMGSRSGR